MEELAGAPDATAEAGLYGLPAGAGRPDRSDRLERPDRPVADALVGRDREQVALRDALAGLAAGRGGVVCVTGGPGAGKSRLVCEATSRARDVATVWVRPTDDAPLALWQQLTAAVARLWRGAAPVGATGLDAARWVRPELLPAPLAVVVDEAERVDPQSAAMLADLALVAPDLPVLLVLAGTGGVAATAGHPAPGSPAGAAPTLRLDLGPLTDAQVGGIVLGRGVDAPGLVGSVVRLAEGNPLVARALADVVAGPPGRFLAASARRVLGERLRAIDGSGVVLALALLDRPVTGALLTEVTGVESRALRRSLDAAVAAGVVERQGRIGRYTLALPLLAEVALADASADAVRAAHLRIATALGPDGPSEAADGGEAARHLIASGIGGDAVTRACLDAALHEEARGRYPESEELAAYGLDSGGTDPLVTVGLQRVLGRCHGRAGRVLAAREVLTRAVELARAVPDARAAADAVADLGVVDLSFVPTGPGRAELLESARRGTTPGSAVHTRLTASLSAALYLTDLPRARALAAEAVAAASAGDDPQTLALATYTWSFAAVGTRDMPTVARLAELWRRHHASSGYAPLVFHLGPALQAGDRPEVDYILARSAQSARALPMAAEGGLHDVARLALAVGDGDGEAVRALVEALHDVESQITAPLGAVAQMLWAVHSGEWLDLPPAALASAMPTTGLGRLFLLGAAAVDLHLGGGRPEETLRALDRQRDRLNALPDDLTRDTAAALLAFVGHQLGDAELCRTAAEALAGHDDEMVVVASIVAVGPAGWFLAWAYEGLGRHDLAVAANAAARAVSQRLGARAWVLQCALQEAWLLRTRDPVRSGRIAEQAQDEAERLGLRTVAALARSLAPDRAAMPRIEQGGRHAQILRLAAAGMTNEQIARRLFLSVSTVERHFTHIYRALGVRNRAEAVAVFGEQDTAPSDRQRGA